MPEGRIRNSLVAAVVCLLASAALAGPARAEYDSVPTPNVTGPIAVTADSYPFLATDIDLSRWGYVEQEFFITGRAYRYDTSGSPRPVDQTATRIETGGTQANGSYPFKTRIVVRRPADPADANGTVVAEWNNVTAGRDIEWNWLGDPFFLLKNGYTFVGVTAQWAGVNGLSAFNAARYGDLEVRWAPSNPTGPTTDDLSYDIFGAALKAIRGHGTGEDPMGGIQVETVIASGESQSCGRLAAHHNFIEPLHQIVDAYLLTVCGSSLRTDRPEKVVRILSETENRTPRSAADFPDTGSLRHWEVAGSSHLPRMAWDNGASLLNRDYLPISISCTKNNLPLSRVQWPFTVNRAIKGIEDWVASGQAPPIAPRGVYLEGTLSRNEFGIADGGIRFPEITVPTAVNDGVNSPPESGGTIFSPFCGLLGSSTEFPQSTLDALYVDHADYVKKYSAATDELRQQDFVLSEDAARLKKIAREYPRLRPSRPHVEPTGKKVNRPRLVWTASEAPGTTFVVERARVQGKKPLRWTRIVARVTRTNSAFRNARVQLGPQPQGIWRYRVRSSSVIPENNVAPAETVTTPFSRATRNVNIRR